MCSFSLSPLQKNLDTDYPGYQWDSDSISRHPERLKSMIPTKYHSLLGELYWLKLIEFTYDSGFKLHNPLENMLRLFNIVTTLEPHILGAYAYTLFIYDTMDSITYPGLYHYKLAVLNKGIAVFPAHWLFYREKALIYKLAYKNKKKAADILYQASMMPNAPALMSELAFYSVLDTGNDALLEVILNNLAKRAKTPDEKRFAQVNRAWLTTVLDRQRLGKIVSDYRQKYGHYPVSNWKKLSTKIVMGLPLFGGVDPAGYAYQLNKKTGEIQLDPASPFRQFDLLYKTKTIKASKHHERH